MQSKQNDIISEDKGINPPLLEQNSVVLDQNFYSIRDKCLEDNCLFEDSSFPPNNASLYLWKDRLTGGHNIEWKRASEIGVNPCLFVGGASRFDIKQGELGDCWLLAAMASLTLHKRLLKKVVPVDQGFTESYAGVFHFK